MRCFGSPLEEKVGYTLSQLINIAQRLLVRLHLGSEAQVEMIVR